MRHTISVLVENKSGVLARISGLFSARGYNIDSLAVGETEDPTISKMTIVVKGDDKILEQVKKQLGKLIDVISIKDFTKKDYIDRELLLFKVEFGDKVKSKVLALLEKNKANVLHHDSKHALVEFVGTNENVVKLLDHLKPYRVKDMTRTGKIAIEIE